VQGVPGYRSNRQYSLLEALRPMPCCKVLLSGVPEERLADSPEGVSETHIVKSSLSQTKKKKKKKESGEEEDDGA
jgi:hypothetical protein